MATWIRLRALMVGLLAFALVLPLVVDHVDDARGIVEVTAIRHRADAYRP